MRRFLIAVFLIGIVMGCDTTEDFLLNVNLSPTINYTFLDRDIRFLEDSVKLSTQFSYPQSFTVEDNNIEEVFFKVIGGQGKVISQGSSTERTLEPRNEVAGIYDFNYTPEGLGKHEIVITALDKFQEKDTVVLKLTAFGNLKPVAAFSIKPNRVVSKFEYTIDASASFDRDAKYGGKIVAYQFTINSQVIDYNEPVLRYVFGGKDIVAISVRVRDNDGQWSNKSEELFLID